MIRSLEEVRPFPRVEASFVSGRKNRNQGRTRILTDIPEKEEITAKKQKRIRSLKQPTMKHKTMRPVVTMTKTTEHSFILVKTRAKKVEEI